MWDGRIRHGHVTPALDGPVLFRNWFAVALKCSKLKGERIRKARSGTFQEQVCKTTRNQDFDDSPSDRVVYDRVLIPFSSTTLMRNLGCEMRNRV